MDGFLGYAGALWVKTGIKTCRRANLQVCSFFLASGGAFLLAPVQGLLGQGWGWGGASNLASPTCWVGVPSAGPIRMGFWGMLGHCGSKLALRRLEGQSYRFAAFFGPLEALFFRRLCRACRGRAGAGVAQVTFPPSGAGLGCLARALFGWFSGVCWGFVGQNWHSGV